jgi:isocitrate dehydrogenase (NAD+)
VSVNVRLHKALEPLAQPRAGRVAAQRRPATRTPTWSWCARTPRACTGIEHEVIPGVVESIRIMTRTACERICRFAFE